MESICKPPKNLSLEGNLSENWRKFRQNFEIFLQASGSEAKKSEVKVALLLNVVGEDGVELYNTFSLDAHERRDLDKVLQAFEEYCSQKKNVVYESFKFWNRSQAEGETFDSFLYDLQNLIETCEYGNVKDSLLRDRIVLGVRDKALQERLLRIDDLELQEAIDYCRAAEIDDVRKSYSNKFTKPKKGEAFGKQCKKCGIHNHLTLSCRVKGIEQVDEDEYQEETGEEETSDEEDDALLMDMTGHTTPISSSRNTSQRSPTLNSQVPPRGESKLRTHNLVYPDLNDVTFDEDEEEEEFNASIPNSSNRQFRTNARSDFSELNESFNKSKRINEFTRSRNAPKKPPRSASTQNPNRGEINPLVLLCAATVAVVAVGIFTESNSGAVKESDRVDDIAAVIKLLRTEMMSLKSLFPSQDEGMWGDIASGIAGVKTKTHSPAVFLLLAVHNETTTCLAKKVAKVAQTVLNGVGDVVLTPNMFENDIGKVFDLMEDKIKQSKAVVVLDLLSLQAEAMKAFHDICDQYNPLVDEAVYLYTMRTGGVEAESKSLMKLAERELRNSFSRVIKEDTLTMLITRITNGAVFAIRAEERIPCDE